MARADRFVPLGTAWDRLGPDKFFSPRTKLTEESPWRPLVFLCGYTTGSGSFRTGSIPEYAGWLNLVPGTGWKIVRRCGGFCTSNLPGRRRALHWKCAVAHAGGQPREGSTSAFAPKLRRDKQVVDISPKIAEICVASAFARKLRRDKPRRSHSSVQVVGFPQVATKTGLFRVLPESWCLDRSLIV